MRIISGGSTTIDGFTLDPKLQLLANMGAKRARDDLSLEDRRLMGRSLFRLVNAPRRQNVQSVDSVIPGPGGKLPIRSYESDGLGPDAPGILFFHQGGMVLLDLDTCDTFCTIIADECRARVISVDYRLCPEHAFPAALDDAMAAWDYVQNEGTELGIDPTKVAIAGDSAGGLITAVTCQQLQARGGVQPIAQCLIYPWVVTDAEPSGSMLTCAETFPLDLKTMEYFMEQLFPGGIGRDHPLANPLQTDDLVNLPPAVVVTAGFDPLRDQGNEYAEKLRTAGIDVAHHCFDTMCHGFIAMGDISPAVEEATMAFVNDFARILGRQHI